MSALDFSKQKKKPLVSTDLSSDETTAIQIEIESSIDLKTIERSGHFAISIIEFLRKRNGRDQKSKNKVSNHFGAIDYNTFYK